MAAAVAPPRQSRTRRSRPSPNSQQDPGASPGWDGGKEALGIFGNFWDFFRIFGGNFWDFSQRFPSPNPPAQVQVVPQDPEPLGARPLGNLGIPFGKSGIPFPSQFPFLGNTWGTEEEAVGILGTGNSQENPLEFGWVGDLTLSEGFGVSGVPG